LRVLEAMRVQLRVYDKAVIQRARSDDTARQLTAYSIEIRQLIAASTSFRPGQCKPV
jgi:hypothetical protein